MYSTGLRFIRPEWQRPSQVHVVTTTRWGGASGGRYASLNLAAHVDDDVQSVSTNRRLLVEALGLSEAPAWLCQTHSSAVVKWGEDQRADACWTDCPGQVCVVQTADCLPVVLIGEAASVVAVAHAGWRGLAAGILESTVRALPIDRAGLWAWLGPAIGPQVYEVGEEVFCALTQVDAAASTCFVPHGHGRWLANLYALARRRLQQLGIKRCYGGHYCTYTQQELFFSHRRDGLTGRMATLVWMEERDE